MKVEHVNGEIARSAAEEAKKKALEDLEAERAQSRRLSDDVERLKGELLEKTGAIAQAGKAIEDLRVANTELARSNREIERANTRLVGENTALEESVRGMFPSLDFFFKACLVFAKVPCIALYRAQGRTPGRPSRGSQHQGSTRSGGCFEPSSADGDK